jgi:hypothetical protein
MWKCFTLSSVYLFIWCFALVANPIFSQRSSALYFRSEASVGIPLGEKTYQRLFDFKGSSFAVPERARFDNFLYSISLSALYRFNEVHRLGLGGAVNFALRQEHPIFQDEQFNRIFFPVYMSYELELDILAGMNILVNPKVGYSFINENFHYYKSSYALTTRGGLMGDISMTFESNKWKVPIAFSIGFRIHSFEQDYSHEFLERIRLNDVEVTTYKLYYQTIHLGVQMPINRRHSENEF